MTLKKFFKNLQRYLFGQKPADREIFRDFAITVAPYLNLNNEEISRYVIYKVIKIIDSAENPKSTIKYLKKVLTDETVSKLIKTYSYKTEIGGYIASEIIDTALEVNNYKVFKSVLSPISKTLLNKDVIELVKIYSKTPTYALYIAKQLLKVVRAIPKIKDSYIGICAKAIKICANNPYLGAYIATEISNFSERTKNPEKVKCLCKEILAYKPCIGIIKLIEEIGCS